MQEIRRSYPALEERYEALYSENRPSGACRLEHRRSLADRISGAAQGLGVPFLLPHARYRGRLPLYDELHLLLIHMAELYAARGIPTRALKQATERYAAWLTERKRIFNRKRSLRQVDVEREVLDLFTERRAENMLGNAKLAAFLREVALDCKVFDYLTLSLGPAA